MSYIDYFLNELGIGYGANDCAACAQPPWSQRKKGTIAGSRSEAAAGSRPSYGRQHFQVGQGLRNEDRCG